jgi:hypothetical protein
MYCHEHRAAVAVASCRACGKGLCHECVRDEGSSVACRGACESEVKATNEAIRVAFEARRVNAFALRATGLMLLLPPSVLALLHAIGPEPQHALPHVVFAGFGLALYVAGRRLAP